MPAPHDAPLKIKRKVLAYITHGHRLLIFRQPHAPEAGLQVPGGTVESGEDVLGAVRREAEEETGLAGLEVVGALGEQWFDVRPLGRAELLHRHFFHLRCSAPPPDQWHHWEEHASDGSGPHLFEFFWVPLPHGVPPLIAAMDHALPRLWAAMQGMAKGGA